VVERCLTDVGIAFFFAPTFHPAMRHVAQTRRELGVRTVFNLLGPLTNPAGAKRQVVGVPASEYTDLIAHALMRLGSEHAWVVHGSGGIDEVSTSGYTKVSECRAGTVRTFFLHPDDFGVENGNVDSTRVSGLDESIKITRDVLDGASGVARNLVLVNVAAGLLVAGSVSSLADGAAKAAQALDNGSAARKLEDLVRCSQEKID
jgi:anthranilate phosphoribosyltransferase